MIARVLPDIAGLARAFDYQVPEAMADRVRVGTLVRVTLAGRRVGGWVVALADEPETDRPLQPLAKITGWGPSADVIELARWAAWRWAGRVSSLLKTSSPPGAVAGLPLPSGGDMDESRAGLPAVPTAPGSSAGTSAGDWVTSLAADALLRPLSLVRLPPAADPFDIVLAAAANRDPLVLAPSNSSAAYLAARLRRAGHAVALVPRDWARAAAGGCVAIGTRAAAWAPRPALGAVVVIDEHDEVYQEERAPTWNARDVVIERSRRAGAPCVLVSPCPSLETLASGAELLVASRADEREGWPVVEVVDRRDEPPGLGLWSTRVVTAAREAQAGARMVCVLNRKGRARLLSCSACGELARCEICGAAVGEQSGALSPTTPEQPQQAGLPDDHSAVLVCGRCGEVRPRLCASCGSTALKTLRVGVTRAREELELLAGQPVGEVTASGSPGAGEPAVPDAAVLVGTEAVLHRVAGARVVAFLDFDQELLAPRFRAGEQALALLALAARLVGGRASGGRLIVQTRLPTHEVIDAVRHADPSRFALVESARRAALALPPERALAKVSGEAAATFVDALPEGHELDVGGPASDGTWLLRAATHDVLCATLAATPRPSGRLRVEVDPLRA